jgi:ABC-type Fe3+/spermidine/putrescine transport system ATPase subunit
MHDGEIIQIAKPHEVYAHPANLFVAQFVGEMNFVPGKVVGSAQVECAFGVLPLSVPAGASVGNSVTLAIRPEHVKLGSKDGAFTSLVGAVASKNYLGDAALLEVAVNGVTLMAKLAGDVEFSIGDRAAVELPMHRWLVFP